MAAPVAFGHHVSGYFSSADGAADLFALIDVGAQHAQNLPLTPGQLAVAKEVSTLASDAWTLLAFPDIFDEGAKFFEQWTSGTKAPDAGWKVTLQGVTFANAISKAGAFVHSKSWVNLGAAGPALGGVYAATWLFSDAVDTYDQAIAFHETTAWDAEAWLCVVNLVKDVASVVLALISLTLVIFGIAAEAVLILPTVILGLSTIYITTKMFAHFYQKWIEQPDPELVLP